MTLLLPKNFILVMIFLNIILIAITMIIVTKKNYSFNTKFILIIVSLFFPIIGSLLSIIYTKINKPSLKPTRIHNIIIW